MDANFLSRFKVVLLDMNGTFMFGHDRFGDSEDFYETYQALGGARLDASTLNDAIRNCFRGMLKDYENPSKLDDFPTVEEGLEKYAKVNPEDVRILENVFAHHERGYVPPEFAHYLRTLSKSHKLGLISNIWGKKDAWLMEFESAEIIDVWHTMIFSSDTRSVKPSLKLFQKAIESYDVPVSQMVYIGDSLRVDIEPAKRLGLSTIWITSKANAHPLADYVLPSLLDLEN